MIKIILYVLILLVTIYTIMIFIAIKIKKIDLSDIDINHNKIISFSELLYVLDSKERYYIEQERGGIKYITKDEISFYAKRYKVYKEIFALKDGLTITRKAIDNFSE